MRAILAGAATWVDREGREKPITMDDIVIITPYNAQVFEIQQRLPGARVGTVDKFQGQEAPIAIYSTATSSHADAPRGMEFLYSLNRLNVATSRAKCVSILVGSPQIFEAECRTPRQIQLANAFCRYLEMATSVCAGRVSKTISLNNCAGGQSGKVMEFKIENSFAENLALFKAEAEKSDPECAKILFENLHLLDVEGETGPSRAVIGEFHKAVLKGLEALQAAAEAKSHPLDVVADPSAVAVVRGPRHTRRTAACRAARDRCSTSRRSSSNPPPRRPRCGEP